MMVLKRWMVAAIVVVSACVAASQATAHHSKPKPKAVVVQPDRGVPPDQAVEPDASAPLTQAPNYDPPPPPPREPDPDPPPPPVALPQPTAPPMIAAVEKPPPMRLMTPEEKQLEQDSTRLLTLARELKEEVAKAGIDTLSLSALRKADEIQRLSKNLKERLRGHAQ